MQQVPRAEEVHGARSGEYNNSIFSSNLINVGDLDKETSVKTWYKEN